MKVLLSLVVWTEEQTNDKIPAHWCSNWLESENVVTIRIGEDEYLLSDNRCNITIPVYHQLFDVWKHLGSVSVEEKVYDD